MNHEEIALLGRVTASTSHEIKNVLAILREAFGLIKDVLEVNRKAELKFADRIERAMGKVEVNMARGVAVTDRLNQLAHTPDEERARVSLSSLADLATALMQRRARQGKVEFICQVATGGLEVEGSPIVLLAAVLACVEHCLERCPEDSSLTLRMQGGGQGPQMAFLPGRGGLELEPGVLAGRLGAMADLSPSMAVDQGPDGLVVRLGG